MLALKIPIRIFSRCSNLQEGLCINIAVAGGLSLRDEVDISNRKYYTTSPPSKVASQGVWLPLNKTKDDTLSRSPHILSLDTILYFQHNLTHR